jgi:hypothetical protein
MSNLPAVRPEPNAEFASIHAPGARGVHFNSSEGLSSMRPDISYGAVWCSSCNKPCDFEISGLHNLFGKPDSEGHHRGYLLIRAECHGEIADILMTFQQARENAGKSIIAFAQALKSLDLECDLKEQTDPIV